MLSKIKKCHSKVVSIFTPLQHPFILIFRLYFGWQFFIHGKGKFEDIEKVVGLFGSLGIPLPEISAYLVATVELAGGLLLLAGLASRLAAVPLTITMIVAMLTAHLYAVKTIFSDPEKFLNQPPIMFLITCFLVLIFGPGGISLDGIIKRLKKV